MKLSIITVALNAEKTIKNTIESVLNQNYKDFEYIIKDGNSIDATFSIINSYSKQFNDKGIKYKIIRNIDKGIYSAMNLAILHAKGEWVLFLNADDKLYNFTVLHDIFTRDFINNTTVLYGYSLMVIGKKHKFVMLYNHNQLKNRFSIGHQSCVVKTEVMKKIKFNEKFKISGDRYFFTMLYQKNYIFKEINMIISEVSRNGVSSKKKINNFYEDFFIMNGNVHNKKKFLLELSLYCLKSFVSKIFPFWENYRFCKNNMRRF